VHELLLHVMAATHAPLAVRTAAAAGLRGMCKCVAVCCSVLHCVALCHGVLQCVAVCCSVLQYVEGSRSVMQCVAVYCSVLKLVYTTCVNTKNALHNVDRALCVLQYMLQCCNSFAHCTATHLNTLQHTATHCNTLQHTATHCNALQRITTL